MALLVLIGSYISLLVFFFCFFFAFRLGEAMLTQLCVDQAVNGIIPMVSPYFNSLTSEKR